MVILSFSHGVNNKTFETWIFALYCPTCFQFWETKLLFLNIGDAPLKAWSKKKEDHIKSERCTFCYIYLYKRMTELQNKTFCWARIRVWYCSLCPRLPTDQASISPWCWRMHIIYPHLWCLHQSQLFSVFTWFLINTLVTSAKARDSEEKFSAHLCDLSNNEDKLETASVKSLLQNKSRYNWAWEIGNGKLLLLTFFLGDDNRLPSKNQNLTKIALEKINYI